MFRYMFSYFQLLWITLWKKNISCLSFDRMEWCWSTAMRVCRARPPSWSATWCRERSFRLRMHIARWNWQGLQFVPIVAFTSSFKATNFKAAESCFLIASRHSWLGSRFSQIEAIWIELNYIHFTLLPYRACFHAVCVHWIQWKKYNSNINLCAV